jgi:phosphate ABC transporter permease protein PstC
MEAGTLRARGGPTIDQRSSRSRALDPLLRWVLTGLAALILILIAFFFIRLFVEAKPAFDKFGYIGFVFDNNWDVSKEVFGAWPLLVGTVITSAIALVIGVPVAISTALYISELCPRRARQPLTILIELLAAVPSVVYGLWGIKVLAPKLQPAEQWFSDKFSFLPLVGGSVSIPNCFIAGLIMAIMILPIVSAISREVMATVPAQDKEAALALGATRWEMIRIAVLPRARSGIVGASLLGLGRALGETIAVTMVIGNAVLHINTSIFSQGATMASVIANEFTEATEPFHLSALFVVGFWLLIVALLVNIIARLVVRRGVAL